MKQRIAIWDNYKFLLILLVVIGHIAQELYYISDIMKSTFLFIYIFHMPAFLFVSGLFSKRTINEKNYKKVLPYFTCFVVTVILQFMFKTILLGENKLSFFSLGGLPWFLFALFVMYFITMITKNYKPKFIMVMALLIGVFVGFSKTKDATLFSWMRIAVYYPFFYAGYITDHKKIVTTMDKKWLKVLAIIFFGLLIFFTYIHPEFFANIFCLMTAKHPYTHMKELANWGWAFRLMLYGLAFAASFLLISIVPKKEIKLATNTGKRTLAIYMTHFFFVYLVTRTIGMHIWLQEVMPIGWDVVMIGVAILITFICGNKWFDWCVQKLVSYDWKLKKIDKE